MRLPLVPKTVSKKAQEWLRAANQNKGESNKTHLEPQAVAD